IGPPAVDGEVGELRQFARQVLDVHAGPAVDVGRVLAREERDLHLTRERCRPCRSRRRRPARRRTGDCPPPRRRRPARRAPAARPATTPCMRTEPTPSAPVCPRTPGDTTERRTVPPEMTTRAQTSELSACPTRPGSSKTNFAGGSGSSHVRIGHSWL